uniref:Uncharacterized protein n=1 Tax=Sander lucioperca TaxID=283035 RepID=A0A8D0D534_SANLU
ISVSRCAKLIETYPKQLTAVIAAKVTSCTLWDAFKAYLRGCVISYEAAKKKKEVTQCKHLEERIQQLDRQNALNPTPDLHREITNLKYQLNQLLSRKITSAFLFIKQKHFEFGEKPHKLLARQLRKIEADRTIHKIRDDRGHILLKPKEINFWKTLPISLLGRINAIKMIFLPQILYLFQNIPVFLTKSFFKKIDSVIQPFLWDYKTPRINKKHLTKSKTNGGLSLPNFMMYYWACTFKSINSFNITYNTLPTWLAIEMEDCDPYLPAALVLSPTPLDKSKDEIDFSPAAVHLLLSYYCKKVTSKVMERANDTH